jgi:hypothetical protein
MIWEIRRKEINVKKKILTETELKNKRRQNREQPHPKKIR